MAAQWSGGPIQNICNDDFDEILVLVHKNAYDHTHTTQETVLDILLRLAQDCDFTRE